MSKLPMIWEEYNYMYFAKDKDWKWSVGIVAATIALISFMFSNITFGFLVIVSTLVLMIHAFKEPKMLRFEINTTGVRINQKTWNFSELGSFWIEDNREHHIPSRIFFSKMHEVYDPVLILTLPIDVSLKEIHDIHEEMVKILPEEKMKESVFHSLMEYLGF